MSDPEQAGLRKSPSSPDHEARSSTAVLALCLSGRGRYLGNLRHLSGKRDAGSSSLGEQSPPAPSQETNCHQGGARRRDSEGTGSTPPSDGAAAPALAAACEAGLTRARMLPHPSSKGRQPGALGGGGRGGASWSWAGFYDFFCARGHPEAVLPSSKATSFRKRVATQAETN